MANKKKTPWEITLRLNITILTVEKSEILSKLYLKKYLFLYFFFNFKLNYFRIGFQFSAWKYSKLNNLVS